MALDENEPTAEAPWNEVAVREEEPLRTKFGGGGTAGEAMRGGQIARCGETERRRYSKLSSTGCGIDGRGEREAAFGTTDTNL